MSDSKIWYLVSIAELPKRLRAGRLAVAWLLFVCSASLAYACPVDGAYTDLAIEIQKRFKEKSSPLAGQVYLADEKIRQQRAAIGAIDDPVCDSRRDIEFVLRTVFDTLLEDGVVMLGEIHDNELHHWLQGELVKLADKENVRPAVVFEQFVKGQQSDIDTFLNKGSPDGSAEELLKKFKAAVQWQKSGWQKHNYDAVLMAVLMSGFKIYAGDANRTVISSAAKGSKDSVSKSEQKRLRLDVPLGAAFDSAMIDEIDKAHCGLMPKTAYTGMAYAQRLRDATLADAVLEAVKSNQGAILIAGSEHVRLDQGVGWYLAQRDPDRAVFSISFVETGPGQAEPLSHFSDERAQRPVTDAVLFTPRVQRSDPCDGLRKKYMKKP